MTEDEAESIVLAAELGVFKGARSELAIAKLILMKRDLDDEEKSDSENKPNKL